MPAGWNIRVTTFNSEGKPRMVRNFLAYEPDEERAIALVRNTVNAHASSLSVPNINTTMKVPARLRPVPPKSQRSAA